MQYCTNVHGYRVKHESGIKNKWHCKILGSEELLKSTIFRDSRKFLGNFGYFWYPCSAATRPSELEISPKQHRMMFYKIVKNRNH